MVGKAGRRRALRTRAGNRRGRRGRLVLQASVLGVPDSKCWDCPGVRGVLFGVPEASMRAAGVPADAAPCRGSMRLGRPHAGPGGRKPTSICRPPSGLARVMTVAPWASAIAWTIESPRPWPSPWLVRSVPRRWKAGGGARAQLGDDRSVVGDRQDGTCRVRHGRDLDSPSDRVVADRVVDQVRDQAFDELGIALDLGGVERGMH